MRLKKLACLSIIACVALALYPGCDQSKVEVTQAPPSQALPKQEVPKERTKGGGSGSSGSVKGNPFDPFKKNQ
jgi:hypothetical protein